MSEPKPPAQQPNRTEKPWWFPGWPSLRDAMTSLIALIIIGFWVVALYTQLQSGTQQGIQSAQAVSAILGPILGAVLGYYFGVSSGEKTAVQAERRANEAVEEKAAVKALSDQELAAAERRYIELEERINRLLVELERGEGSEPTSAQ